MKSSFVKFMASTSKPLSAQSKIKSIHQCFKWLYILLFYTGILGFRQRNGALFLNTLGSAIYKNIARIALVVGFIGGIALKLSNEESAHAMLGHLTPVLRFVLVFECTISTLTYIQVSVIMDFNKVAHMQLANRLQHYDDSMVREFPLIRWNYHKSVRKYTPLTISVVIFYITVALTYLYNLANCSCDLLTTFVIAICYALITAAPGCASFLHIGTMDMLRIRFRLIRHMLDQYYADSDHYKNQSELHLRISRLIYYFKNYTELLLEVNTVFGYICAAGIFYDFGILTNMVFLLCLKASESRSSAKDYISILLFMAPRMYKVIMTAAYGYMVHSSQKKCIHSICMYSKHFPASANIRGKVQSFIHWRMHHNYGLRIGRMIRCDLIVLYMAINGIANYVIILIQLQFQQNSITGRLKHHDMSQDVELINPKSY